MIFSMVKTMIKILIVLLTILFSANVGFSITTYIGTEPQTFGWDSTNTPPINQKYCDGTSVPDGIIFLWYELEFIHTITDDIYTYTTQELRLTVKPPKLGIYNVRVRAVWKNAQGQYWKKCDLSDIVSTWCNSTDPLCALLKTGEAGSWEINYMLPTPEEIFISPIPTEIQVKP